MYTESMEPLSPYNYNLYKTAVFAVFVLYVLLTYLYQPHCKYNAIQMAKLKKKVSILVQVHCEW